MALNLTPSMETYLETIYVIHTQNKIVYLTDISIKLEVSKQSVNRAVQNLTKLDLIEHECFGPLYMTEKGKRIARRLVDNHNIIKEFLIQQLGLSEESAEFEASKIHHVISQKTIDKIKSIILRYNVTIDKYGMWEGVHDLTFIKNVY